MKTLIACLAVGALVPACSAAPPVLHEMSARSCRSSPMFASIAVLGEVQHPGLIASDRSATLGQALRTAGGFAAGAAVVQVTHCFADGSARAFGGPVAGLTDRDLSRPLMGGDVILVSPRGD